MSRARITVDAFAGSKLDILPGATVQLDNDGDGGEASFLWTLLAAPDGSAAALSDANAKNPTFDADLEGTYLLRLVVDRNLATEAENRVVVGVRQVRTGLRIPAAGERTEADSASGATAGEGWSPDVGAALALLDAVAAGGAEVVCVAPVGAVAGKAVHATGAVTHNGLVLPEVALATNWDNGPVGIVVARVRFVGAVVTDTTSGHIGDVARVTNIGDGSLEFGTATDAFGGGRGIGRVLTVGAAGVVILGVVSDNEVRNNSGIATISANEFVTPVSVGVNPPLPLVEKATGAHGIIGCGVGTIDVLATGPVAQDGDVVAPVELPAPFTSGDEVFMDAAALVTATPRP